MNPLVSLFCHLVVCGGRKRGNRQTDGQTDRQTHLQTKYCNPRCACAPTRRGLITLCWFVLIYGCRIWRRTRRRRWTKLLIIAPYWITESHQCAKFHLRNITLSSLSVMLDLAILLITNSPTYIESGIASSCESRITIMVATDTFGCSCLQYCLLNWTRA